MPASLDLGIVFSALSALLSQFTGVKLNQT
jgi:hypothetical protein